MASIDEPKTLYVMFFHRLLGFKLKPLPDGTLSMLKSSELDLTVKHIPSGGGVVKYGSELYMIGGEIVEGMYEGGEVMALDGIRHGLSNQVYQFDPCTNDFILRCSIGGPKAMPAVGLVNGGIFAFHCSPFVWGKWDVEPPFFELFNGNCWEPLPEPPFCKDEYEHGRVVFHLVLGDKLFVPTRSGLYLFDFLQNEWRLDEVLLPSIKSIDDSLYFPIDGLCVSECLGLESSSRLCFHFDLYRSGEILLYAYLFNASCQLEKYQIIHEVDCKDFRGVSSRLIELKNGQMCALLVSSDDRLVVWIFCFSASLRSSPLHLTSEPSSPQHKRSRMAATDKNFLHVEVQEKHIFDLGHKESLPITAAFIV